MTKRRPISEETKHETSAPNATRAPHCLEPNKKAPAETRNQKARNISSSGETPQKHRAPSKNKGAQAAAPEQPQSASRAAHVLQALEIPALIAVPLALGLAAFFQIEQSALATFAVALVSIAIFFGGFEASKPDLRHIMPTVVLGALAAAGRILFAPLPNFKPVSAICIIAGAVFGKRCGFMVGALAALVSNFFFGQGPWTPWQMYAWGMVGYFAGIMAKHGVFERTPLLLGYGFASALLYGLILNGWYIVGFVQPLTAPAALMAYAAGLPFDLIHGTATVAFLAALYLPWRKKLIRVKTKYALSEGTA